LGEAVLGLTAALGMWAEAEPMAVGAIAKSHAREIRGGDTRWPSSRL
jgi:hypothetical protein